MDELVHAHPQRDRQMVLPYGCWSKFILEKRVSFSQRSTLDGTAEAMEPDAYHKAKDLNNDEDASL